MPPSLPLMPAEQMPVPMNVEEHGITPALSQPLPPQQLDMAQAEQEEEQIKSRWKWKRIKSLLLPYTRRSSLRRHKLNRKKNIPISMEMENDEITRTFSHQPQQPQQQLGTTFMQSAMHPDRKLYPV